MTALVTDNLPLVSSAPNGIAKLRELILVLAVRGKLVPHDPSDEAAAELLKRTADARAQRPRRGKAQNRPQAPGASEDWPHVIPSGWQWCRLADLVEVLNGRAYKKEELLDAGTPVLRVGNLFTSNHWYYSDLELDEDRYCLPGDLLYAWSASFGPFIWSGDRAIYHYHIWKLEPHSDADLNRRYLHTYLAEQTQAIKAAGHGVSMTHMTKEKMERIAVPVPPLAEQARIVAKVDELMALCDRLEAEQADAEAAHAKLVEALLASLTQARDAADFRASWQQLAEHFHTLFTTDDSVEALRNSIFELAARGRLAEQRSADGSAASLITRLQAHKERLAKQGGLRLPKPSVPVDLATVPFSIPESWCWARWNEIALKIGDIDHKMPEPDPDGVPFVSPRDFLSGNVIDFDGAKRVARADFERLSAKIRAERGDLIYPRYGTIGENVLVEVDREFLVSYSCAVIKVATGFVDPRYQFYVSLSRCIRNQAKAAENKTTQANVGIKSIQEFLFPVPPFEEQRRIVAKVDELLNLCDQLKLNLAQARQRHEHLASALVEKAVA